MTRAFVAELPELTRTARRIARQFVPSRWHDDAVQEALLAAWRASQRYDGRVKLRTYLEHRVRGSVIDSLRKFMGDRRRGYRLPDVSLEQLTESGWDVGSVVEPALDHQDAFERLVVSYAWTRREVQVCGLLWRDGLSYHEAASELGISESRVYQLRRKVLRHARECLADGT